MECASTFAVALGDARSATRQQLLNGRQVAIARALQQPGHQKASYKTMEKGGGIADDTIA
jgi:hypothetical protein